MKTVTKVAVNPDTGQSYLIDLPGPEVVRQAILELEYPSDGIRVVNATEKLAEKFNLSEHQKHAKNRNDLNVFRYDVVAPQFRRLLGEGKLEQPNGPRTPYFLAESDPSETPSQPEWPSVERTAANPKTGEEYQIEFPATPVVKQALLDFEYPLRGIHITDIAETLADQFALTEEHRKAKGKYGLVWKRHVNIAANSLVNSGQLLRIKFGWIINPDSTLFPVDSITDPEQPDIEPSDAEGDSPSSDRDTPSPEVVMAQNYQKHQDRLKDELLQNILDNPPEFFEELVLDLLVAMGYGRSREDAVAVGGPGDLGIDGIIIQDKLGLDAVYVQAKRLAEGIVGRPQIGQFIGDLATKGASKGVFITTSSFSEPAKAAANKSAGPKIALIDGKELVQLMIDHDVGVSKGDFYQLKEIDPDYFAIDDDA